MKIDCSTHNKTMSFSTKLFISLFNRSFHITSFCIRSFFKFIFFITITLLFLRSFCYSLSLIDGLNSSIIFITIKRNTWFLVESIVLLQKKNQWVARWKILHVSYSSPSRLSLLKSHSGCCCLSRRRRDYDKENWIM